MRSDETPEDGEGGLPIGAVVAGLAVLYAAALAVGVFDGAPPERPHGRADVGAAARPGVEAGRSGQALPPGLRLCFHGPGGELIGFAVAVPQQGRPPAAAEEPACRPSSGTVRS